MIYNETALSHFEWHYKMDNFISFLMAQEKGQEKKSAEISVFVEPIGVV